MTTNDNTRSDRAAATPRGERMNTATAILVAMAFLLGAFVIMKAGELPANPAYASASTGSAGFSLVTGRSGFGRDTRPYELLYLIDSRGEMLWVYEVEDAATRRVVLRDGAMLPMLFRAGRGR